ncbi:MAG: hypothetical protein HYV13_03100 [Candidatus Doudnabacteria bacterium]|nr:hypothetical protein [Candidatus Doudnabacteria bacterium]
MPKISEIKERVGTDLANGVLSTLAFFGMYGLPLSSKRVFELLYQTRASKQQVNEALEDLVLRSKVVKHDNLYALKSWDDLQSLMRDDETKKRWKQVDKYFKLLSSIPFIEHISIIHSLAIGNVNSESDIDFFVITKPNRLYFVRSLVIVLFRMFGVYRTRTQIAGRLSFGYYVSSKALDLSEVEGKDPFMAFWFASFLPIFGKQTYLKLAESNQWIYEFLPNYSPQARIENIRRAESTLLKKFLETLLQLPAVLIEPLLRSIHITHTFNLPENHWATSTTIANRDVLKLQAVSQRRLIVEKYENHRRNIAL